MAVGLKMKTTPVDTQAVDDFKVRGAGELAAIVPLAGAEFERAYVNLMAKSHAEALRVIDGQLLPVATSKDLKKHLAAVREDVATHLEEARARQ